MPARILFVLLWFCALSGKAQTGKKAIRLQQAIQQLDSALVQKDTAVLSRLLLPQLSFGHSNALIQDYTAALHDLVSGKLVYRRMEALLPAQLTLVRNTGSVRRTIAVSGALQGTGFQVQLTVLEVWMYRHRKWQLLSRQSARLPEP